MAWPVEKKLTGAERDLFTLCQLLGYKHPDFMLAHLTISQLEDWLLWMRCYYPFPNRLDPYFAILCSLLHNQWAERHEAKRPDDFLLYERPEDRYEADLTAEELAAKLGLPLHR